MIKDIKSDYLENVGKEPETKFPSGHPAAWEWEYTGAPEQRERLLDLIQDEATRVDEAQESLF